MKKLIYLTTNPDKKKEAELVLRDKYGIDIDVYVPDFKIPEIQAETCSKVVKFSAEYAANKMNVPVLKSDSGLYLECLGGLPGPFNAYFAEQIGVEKFLKLLENEENRNAKIEHCFAYCEPGKSPIVFKGKGYGTISYKSKGNAGHWHDHFYIPKGETKTLSELREENPLEETKFWGNALEDFAKWYIDNVEE